MKIISIISLSIILSLNLSAQNTKVVDVAKRKYIEEQLSLTTEQQTSFWLIFSDYTTKRRELKKQIFILLEDGNALVSTDDQIKSTMNKYFEFKQKEIELEKEYYIKLSKVITSRQIVTLIKTEKKFSKMLVQKLEERNAAEK
jgi:hypothetical protein